jgi:hypothetical protein
VTAWAIIFCPFVILSLPKARLMKHGRVHYALYLLRFLSSSAMLCHPIQRLAEIKLKRTAQLLRGILNTY